MIGNKRVLAIIPARGGSKRLPRKNILPLSGKPLIVWSIEAALLANYVDNVVVSTDDEEIVEISKNAGAIVPFLRPVELAGDTSSSVDVVLHMLNSLKKSGVHYDYFILLQPTSPLRTKEDIDSAIQLCHAKSADTVTSVCEAEHSPLWASTLPIDHSMDNFGAVSQYTTVRSQELPVYYRLNGAIYIAAVDHFFATRRFISQNNGFAYIMSQAHSVDIDTMLDFCIAEAVIRYETEHGNLI